MININYFIEVQKEKMKENRAKAFACAKGCYQRNLLRGIETVGGSTLRGRARNYSGRYKTSAYNLIYRLRQTGVRFTIVTGPMGGMWAATIHLH
jgi:hypothetical protein